MMTIYTRAYPDGKELCLKAGRGGRWWSRARYADGIVSAIRYVVIVGLDGNMRGLRGFGRQLIRIVVRDAISFVL